MQILQVIIKTIKDSPFNNTNNHKYRTCSDIPDSL